MYSFSPLFTLFCIAEFADYLMYVRDLGFADAPDYTYMRNLFHGVIKRSGSVFDQAYCWDKIVRIYIKATKLMLDEFMAENGPTR